MVISFYLLLICTDYFPYKLELHFYWLHFSFFIVTALKMFQNQILLGFVLRFCLLACKRAWAAQEGCSSEMQGALQSPSALLRNPDDHSSWALCKLTRKALNFVSIQESLCIKCFVCAHTFNEVMIWSMPTESMFQLHALLRLFRQALLVGTHTSLWFIGSFYLSAHIVLIISDLVRTDEWTPGHICQNITVVIFQQKFRWDWNPLGL